MPVSAQDTGRPTRGSAHGSRAAAVAVGSVFATNGVLVGVYAGVLAALKARLGIEAATVAVLLFTVGVAAVVSMQLGGRLADRLGARGVAIWSLPVMALGAVVIGVATTFPLVLVGGALLGLGNGACDVSMNAVGVEVEKARATPVMSRFHAFWSIGSFVGAGIVLLAAQLVGPDQDVLVPSALLTAAGLSLLALVVTARWVPVTAPVSHVVDGVKAPIPPVAWLLGGMAVCFGLMEGTAYDWSSIHVSEVAHVDPGTGSAGLVVVTVFMVAMRLVGDAAVTRFGHQTVVRGGALVSAVGYTVTAFATSLPLVLLGWALVGLGVAMIAPQVYAAAGHLGGGRMLAVVVTFGYAAFLAGPGILGWLVHTVGVQHAMLLPLVLAFALVVIARWMPAVRQAGARPADRLLEHGSGAAPTAAGQRRLRSGR